MMKCHRGMAAARLKHRADDHKLQRPDSRNPCTQGAGIYGPGEYVDKRRFLNKSVLHRNVWNCERLTNIQSVCSRCLRFSDRFIHQ